VHKYRGGRQSERNRDRDGERQTDREKQRQRELLKETEKGRERLGRNMATAIKGNKLFCNRRNNKRIKAQDVIKRIWESGAV